MNISFFLFKHRKKLLIYTIGLGLILTLLYLLILRHPGYIYYWDLSGAFDFRNPFGQYFNIYTPWDGNNVGVRNRLPIVFLIYLISQPFLLIGLGNEIVIKIAVTLLFVGGYTVMYFLAPKFVQIFSKKEVEKQEGIYIWALIIGLLYSFIPFYVYRVSQFHLFYMSVFYPLHLYLFIKLFESKKFNPKYIAYFVISMFFGLTTPNIIVFEIFTFIVFGIVLLISKIKEKGSIKALITNMLLAAIGVFVTNIYWIFPYFVQGSPQPGYVINSTMIDLLSQGITFKNFLLGQSEWFVNQADLGVLESKDAAIYLLQIFGVIIFYAVALLALIKYVKKKYITPIVIFLLISPLLIFNLLPFQRELQEALLYSPLGWIFREVNRVSFFWAFWTYILFLIGTYSLYESILLDGKLNKILKVIVFPAIFIPFIIFLLPINIKFFKYLKPVEIPSEVQEIFTILKEDEEYFSVLYYPNVDSYSIPWMKDKFLIADAEEYKLLAYNSPKPPVGISSVIPNAKTYQELLTEYLVQNRDIFSNLSHLLSDIGVKYIVVNKTAQPINVNVDYVRAEVVYPVYLYLENREDFEEVLENDYYVLFRNTNFKGVVSNRNNDIYTTASFNILEHIHPDIIRSYNIKFCGFEENYKDCFEEGTFKKTFFKYEKDIYYYLDFLTKEEKETYGVYTYDYTSEHRIGLDWGKASYYDKVNGELHNIFRKYGINGWDFEITDKVVYSDLPLIKKDEGYRSTLSFTEKVNCTGECEVYAYILYNHIGGKLGIEVDDNRYEVDTKSAFEVYRWTRLGDINVENQKFEFNIENIGGFSSLGGILVLPKSVMTELNERISEISFLDVPEDSLISMKEIDISPDSCSFTNIRYKNNRIIADTDCEDTRNIYVSNYYYDYIIETKRDRVEITLNNYKNIYLIFLFFASASLPILVVTVLTLSKKRRF